MENKEINPLDVLTEKCFALLGTLQEKNPESDEWKNKFGKDMQEMAIAMNYFMHQQK